MNHEEYINKRTLNISNVHKTIHYVFSVLSQCINWCFFKVLSDQHEKYANVARKAAETRDTHRHDRSENIIQVDTVRLYILRILVRGAEHPAFPLL
jgi:hypothetical protein